MRRITPQKVGRSHFVQGGRPTLHVAKPASTKRDANFPGVVRQGKEPGRALAVWMT